MATSKGEITILDLNNELIRRFKKKGSAEEYKKLAVLREQRDTLSSINKQLGFEKRRITFKLKKPDLSKSQIDNLERAYKRLGKQRIPLSSIDNEANVILGKDFEYVVVDTWGVAYKIKASDLMKRDNPGLYILQKYKRRVEKAIYEEEDEKKIMIYNRLLDNINDNEQLLETGIAEYTFEDRAAARAANEPYPIFIDFIPPNVIEIGT